VETSSASPGAITRDRVRDEADVQTFAEFVDRFDDDVPSGAVLGSTVPRGRVVRRGVDREGVMGIDAGALRIQPLVKPGWGRSGLAYGPYPRTSGLAFHALVLNGHNISRSEPLPDEFRMRLERWLRGPETHSARERLRQWWASPRKGLMLRRLRQWFRSGAGVLSWPWIEESLAVGWFGEEAPVHPLRKGSNLAVHAVVTDGGELWTRVGLQAAPTLGGLQNLPFHYAVVLRERGAAYYVAAPTDVPGIPRYPSMRLVAIDPFDAEPELYAGVHQSVLGEIGFRAQTRVYGTQVVQLRQHSAWFGSASGADRLTGTGPVAGSQAEVGGVWKGSSGLVRTQAGAVGDGGGERVALLHMAKPAGVVHLLVDCPAGRVDGISLIWRARDPDHHWRLEIGSDYAELAFVEAGVAQRHARIAGRLLPPSTTSSIQVSDDGEYLRVLVNGRPVYGALRDARQRDAAGVGFGLDGASGVVVRAFEAHPREIDLSGLARFDGPTFPMGDEVIVRDDFSGPPGELAGHVTSLGSLAWTRAIGRGSFDLTGDGSARVRASAAEPCPGRTAYMIDWPHPTFADLEVTITPAGLSRGTREKGRSGLILWQDPDNYITISAFVEDWPAMSIAAFFRIDGFEELFDAVWSNVGTRLHWGEPHRFRVTFDGSELAAYINGEPVLYRALGDVYPGTPRLGVRRAGLVANWEWGNDTGSSFADFVGRSRR
jgi:hypothetical protein